MNALSTGMDSRIGRAALLVLGASALVLIAQVVRVALVLGA